MNQVPKAYNELVGLLLTEEDRSKFEWAIGSMLSNAPAEILVVHGESGSGKSTLLGIIRKILLTDVRAVAARVYFQHDGYERVNDDSFVFAASPRPIVTRDDGVIRISTTGDRVSVNKHYVLMNQIDDEANAIAQHCINVYHNTQENNR